MVASGFVIAACTLQGCALFLVGAAAGAAAGTVSYFGNELRVSQEVTVDRAWNAAHTAVTEMQFLVISTESYKDGTGGVLISRNAKQQKIRIFLSRQSDRLTEIRIRIGMFDTDANRTIAQSIYDKMKARL